MKNLTIFILAIILFSFPVLAVDAVQVYSSECTNKGNIDITFYIAEKDYRVDTSSLSLEIGGIKYEEPWSNIKYLKKGTDSSKETNTAKYAEGTFNENKIYAGTLTYFQEYEKLDSKGENATKTLNFKVGCPGLRFTCTNLGVKINSCENTQNGFEANLILKGMEQSSGFEIDPETMIEYHFSAEAPYKQINGGQSKEGSLPIQYSIEKISEDNYKLTFNLGTNTINEMYLKYKPMELPIPCVESLYPNVTFYAHSSCTTGQTTEPITEEPIEETTEEEPTEPITEEPIEETTEEESSGGWVWAIIVVILLVIGFVYMKKKHLKLKI